MSYLYKYMYIVGKIYKLFVRAPETGRKSESLVIYI